MKPPVLTLVIEGKKRRFKAQKVIATSVFLQSLELDRALTEHGSRLDQVKKSLPYICAVFGHRFTEEDLEKNIPFMDILPLAIKCVEYTAQLIGAELPKDKPVGEVIPFAVKRNS